MDHIVASETNTMRNTLKRDLFFMNEIEILVTWNDFGISPRAPFYLIHFWIPNSSFHLTKCKVWIYNESGITPFKEAVH